MRPAIPCLILVACAPPPARSVDEEWRRAENEILERFPLVDHVRTPDVEAMLAQGDVLVLDVRSPEEFAVSRLPGARNLPLGDDLAAELADEPRDRRILTYCSVGYRSAEAAEQLRRAGFTDVHNYLGSIFQWANHGRPLHNDQGETSRVHPYDARWGRLLDGRSRE